MADAPALRRLVGDPAAFLADHFGRRPRYVPAADAGAFADVLSLDDVDGIVTGSGLRAPAFRLVRDGQTLPQDRVTRSARIGSKPVDDLVDVAAVHREVAAGATLVLQGLHRSWAPVARLCRELEVVLTHPVQANAYLTPPVATGLRLHDDPHDVFALQIHGRKRWVVHPHDDEPQELWLEAGDVLYLPAGTLHAPQTVDDPSLHLTIGVRTVTWGDVVRRAVGAALAVAGDLDRPLPPGWAEDPDALADEVARRAAVAVERLDAPAAVQEAAEEFWSGRLPDLAGGLRDLLGDVEVADTTWLRRRPGTVLRVREVGVDQVELVTGTRGVRLPAHVGALLRRVAARERLRPADLDDLADEASRLTLCRRLVREGLLTLDREAGGPPRPAS